MKTTLLPLCALFLFGACTKHDSTAAPGGTKPTAASGGEEHGTPHPLGSLTIGAHTFALTQFGDITPGKEGAIELAFPADKPVPSTVRVWVGIETAEGSVRQRCGKEGEHGLHGHVEVPKALPTGSKIWIEIEENGKTQSASVAWK
jgi:hypothetical protein